MLLHVEHVETEMKNLNFHVTLLVQKGVGTQFPPHYTPAGRSDAVVTFSVAYSSITRFIFSLPDM